jgi:hypothetical protein
MIPEPIQATITERETVRSEIVEAEKALAALARKEKMLSAKIESSWAAQVQKIVDVLGVKG